jgi:Zeta toxin
LQQKGRFPPNQDFVVVDPDQMRHALPEFEGYVQRSPEQAGELTRHEAGMMSEILILAALQQAGNNVLVDGSLRDYEWYTEYFARLRRDYPSFSIAILHITAPRQAVLERAKNRAKITGRVVPQKLLEEVMQQVPASVSRLRSMVDFFVEIHNSGNDGEDVQLVSMSSSSDLYMNNKNATWTEFTNQWRSTTCHHPS